MSSYINVQKVQENIIKEFIYNVFMKENEVLKKLILQKLVRSNTWGGKHTPLDFVTKGVPEHYRNTHKGNKIIEEVIKELTNEGWIIILVKKTGKGSGEHISLNPRKISEIQKFLENIQ